MSETDMLIILERILWLTERNRFIEARRFIQREIENLQGNTELNCKAKNVNAGNCKVCKNLNCNKSKKIKTKKSK